MSRERVTHDPTDPAFPHGTDKGYQRGCSCPRCSRAAQREKKRRHVARVANGDRPTRWAPPTHEQRAVTHVKDLLRIAGVSCQVIGHAAGVKVDTVTRADRGQHLSRRSVNHLLAVTEADVRARIPKKWATAPRDVVVRQIRGMQALGYPLRWQYRTTGHCPRSLIADRNPYVSPRTAEDVAALAARIGSIPATPQNTGTTQSAITQAARAARAAGYGPADCIAVTTTEFVDDDGNLNGRLIPGHPWAEADSRCGQVLEILRGLTRIDRDPEEDTYGKIADRVGTYVRDVDRVAKKARVRSKDPDRRGNAARARQLLAEVDAGDVDYVHAVADLGLLEVGGKGVGIPSDHPAVQDIVQAKQKAKAA